MKTFLIYGSYGYTGRLIVEQAVRAGLRPILAGRRGEPLRRQAEEFRLEYRPFDLGDEPALEAALEDVAAVLHCAGPFSLTYRTVVRACIANRVHYVDISGEIEEFEALAAMDEAAGRAGVMLLPGAGFDVVPSDCLSLSLSRQLPTATRLELNILSAGGGVSRGTARSGIENLQRAGRIRREGKIVGVPNAWRVKEFDFGRGPRPVVSVGWGDVSTAYHSTGIPDIEVYMAFPRPAIRLMHLSRSVLPLLASRPSKNLFKWLVGLILPSGPSREQNRTGFSLIAGEARDSQRVVQASLRTPEAYHLTSLTSVEILRRILDGEVEPGFQTPSRVFGEDFILGFPGVRRETDWEGRSAL